MYTYEEKIDDIVERIFQAVMDEFDTKLTDEEIEEMDENDTYFDTAREQKLGVEGYEDMTFNEMCDLSDEEIVKIHNLMYDAHLTVEILKSDENYWNYCM